MFTLPEALEIDFSVSADDLLGPLGYGEGASVDPSLKEQLLAEASRCEQMMRGKAIYSCVKLEHRTDSQAIEAGGIVIEDETLARSLDGARSLAVAVCTVGAEIDARIESHFGAGDFLNGMVADVVANRAAEDVAERCAALICWKARGLGLAPGRRMSPGYREWDVSGQRAVFALLDPAPIGVSLNEHCMMRPKKSVSFVIPLVEKTGDMMPHAHEKIGDMMPHRVPDFLDMEPPCHGCSFQNCAYRRK
ncbi:MAG: hypothetical protein HY801_15710 [Candidatus Lindowbacteria bacterium]|nr:hypothetical protein [Candidatus Lindowbacteria bacterium]